MVFDLPLRVVDHDDMVIYGILRDAVSVGWLPASNTGTPLSSVDPPVTVVDSVVVPSKRRDYRGVRQRPWGKFPAEIRDPAKNVERIQPQQNWIWQIETAHRSIDTQNIRKQIQEGIHHLANEIKNAMQQVCKTHNLSIAGVWARCRHSTSWSHGGCNSNRCDDSCESGRGDFVVSVPEMLISYGCDLSPSDLMAFDSLTMRVGQGLVGNAFLSDKPFLCRDVTQLSMSQCPIVPTAKSIGFTGCITVCLQSIATGTRDYVLAFYLPPHKTYYTINFHDFFSSMLEILKHHLESFEAVVIDPGDGLFIEVNKLSIDIVFESLKTCPPIINEIDPGALQNEGEVQQSDIPGHHLAMEEFENSGGNGGDSVGLVEERGKAIVPENIIPEKKSKAPNQKESSCSYETLEQHFGKKLEDAAESLGVSRSTVKRWCRENNIKKWPFPKRSKITSLPPIRKQVIEPIQGNVKSISNSREKGLSCSDVPTNLALKQAMDTMTMSTVTVKATYKNDIIKFQLSFSSKMVDLVKNVTLRLKLSEGTFAIKYLDNEGDYVLIACDDDLRDCINSFRISEETTVKMLIEPLSITITG